MSKRLDELKKLIDKTKTYNLDEAIELAKKTSNTKFVASVEVHVRTGIDPRKSDQQIRATVVLPHGTGKTKKIAAFVGPNNEDEAKKAGADFVFGEEEIKKIKTSGKIDFDIAVATPEMMPKLALIARILGPKGLMPNPKTGTVDKNVKKMIEEIKKGKLAFKNDDTSNLHLVIGKVDFKPEQLKENFLAFYEALKKAKPNTMKGTYIKAIYLTTSMGPSIKIDINQL